MLNIFLLSLLICPFISSLAFPEIHIVYADALLLFLPIWIIRNKILLKTLSNYKYQLLFFCLAVGISIIFSVNWYRSFTSGYKYLTWVLLFIVAASLNEGDKIKVIRMLILGAFVISLIAIYQYFFGFQRLLSYLTREKIDFPFALECIKSKRPFSPFSSPDILAGYLAMTIPLVLINKNRILLAIPIFFALLLTKSIGAYLSLSLGVIIYIFLTKGFSAKRIILLTSMAAFLAVILILRHQTSSGHLLPGFSLQQRINYWQDAFRIILRHPFHGIGIGNFDLDISRYAHNFILQVWAEMGIIGLASLFWLIFSGIKANLKSITAGNNKYCLASILLISNIAFLTHNLGDFTFFLPEVSYIWWVIFGLSASE